MDELKQKLQNICLKDKKIITKIISNNEVTYVDMDVLKLNEMIDLFILIRNNVSEKTILEETFEDNLKLLIKSYNGNDKLMKNYKKLLDMYGEHIIKCIFNYDETNKILYCKSNHAFVDGISSIGLILEIINAPKDKCYTIDLPKLTYYPFYSEYIILRTMYDYLFMKKKHNNMLKISRIAHLINFDVDCRKINKFIPNLLSYLMPTLMKFWNADNLNISLLYALKNENKINNVSSISFNMGINDDTNTITNILKKKKYMVIGSYVLSNLFNLSNNNIDVLFSSIPMLKSDIETKPSYFFLPYLSTPIYIFSQKYGKTTRISLHMTDIFNNNDVNNFATDIRSLDKISNVNYTYLPYFEKNVDYLC